MIGSLATRLITAFVLVAAIAAVTAESSYAQDYEFGVGAEAVYWASRMEGKIVGDEPGFNGDSIDLEDDLDIDPTERIFSGWAYADFYKNRIQFSSFSVDYEGVETLDSNFTFDGIVYPALTRVETEISISQTQFLYGRTLTDNGAAGWLYRADVLVGGHYYSAEATITDNGTRNTNVDESFLVPVLGFYAQIDVYYDDYIQVFIDTWMTGMSLNTNAGRGSLVDGYIEVAVAYRENITFGLGYRFADIDLSIDDDGGDDEFDLSIQGFTISASVRW